MTQIELVSYDQKLGLDAIQFSDQLTAGRLGKMAGKNKRAQMSGSAREPKGRGGNIHFPVSNQNVSIAAKATNAAVFMNVFVICVQKISVAYHKIKHRITIAIRFRRIAPENVKNGASVMLSTGNLAVAVVICFPPRIGESLNLEPIGRCNHPKIRIGVPGTRVKMQLRIFQPGTKPVLKMKFFILTAFPLDQMRGPDGSHARRKDRWHHVTHVQEGYNTAAGLARSTEPVFLMN